MLKVIILKLLGLLTIAKNSLQRQFSIWRGEKVFPNKMHREDVPKGGFRERYFHFIRQCMVMVFTYNKMQATGVSCAVFL